MTAETEKREFTCSQCEGTFPKGWSDEEAATEAAELWGVDLIDPVVVCDDCFEMMTAALPIADYRADPLAQIRTLVDEWKATLTPVERFIQDEIAARALDLMFYGETRI